MVEEISKGVKVDNVSDHVEGYESLSEKEKKYFKIMNAKSGVLYISSPPGYAKSAIMRSIAKKMGYQYFDIRLSMIDETDVGLYPTIETMTINNKEHRMLSHVAPKWAYMANTRPSIIHFEELNRSSLAVRNAALQILLEREIGAFFKFNNNVLMCSSGNLGDEDGTDVEEFDQALNNRLIHIEHTLSFTEWVNAYANENVCPTIIQFLNVHTGEYYKNANERNKKNKAYATPRSWTYLSDYIFENYGEYVTKTDSNDNIIIDKKTGKPKQFKKFPRIEVWIDDIKEIGHGYIGASNASFIRYCEDSLKININDILNRFNEIENDVKNFNRDKKSELINDLKSFKIANLTDIQRDNLIKFLQTVSNDEIVAYLYHVIDIELPINSDDIDENVEKFLSDKRLKRFYSAIAKHYKNDK